MCSTEIDSQKLRFINSNPTSYGQAVSVYRKRPPIINTQLLTVEGLEFGYTAYNCAPMVDEDYNLHLLGRLEKIDSEVSEVRKLDFIRNHTSLTNFMAPNGLVIPNSQDPSVSLISADKTAIGVVSVTEDSAKRGQVTSYRPRLYEFKAGDVSRERDANGPESEKDIRIAYVGSFGEEDLSVIVARKRRVDGQNIDSCLQVGIVPTAGDMQQLSCDITQVKNDPTSRLDVLTPDNRTWYGPNQITRLQSRAGDLVLGLLFHTGRWTNRVYQNGERGRVYTAFAAELTADPQTRQVTHVSKPKEIATADDFPDSEAKRPDLVDVLFPGGFIYGARKGLVERTILACGLRDRYIGLAEVAYPFSRPPNERLNPQSTLPADKMPNI